MVICSYKEGMTPARKGKAMKKTYQNDLFTVEVEYQKYEGYTVTIKDTDIVKKFSTDITCNMWLEEHGYKEVSDK